MAGGKPIGKEFSFLAFFPVVASNTNLSTFNSFANIGKKAEPHASSNGSMAAFVILFLHRIHRKIRTFGARHSPRLRMNTLLTYEYTNSSTRT
jgi:hypothetical protein